MSSSLPDVSDEDRERRDAELEALLAIYDEEDAVQTFQKQDRNSAKAREGWKIRVGSQVVLELELPHNYPSEAPPKAGIQAPQYILHDGLKADLLKELSDMWTVDTEVAILWAEHCRMFLEEHVSVSNNNNNIQQEEDENDDEGEDEADDNNPHSSSSGTHTFVPASSKFGQPVRHFDTSIIHNDTHQCVIHHGPSFRPPKSGPSETLVAHVARVHNMNEVQWVLAQLLEDKKIAKASHNMMAYRFISENNGKAPLIVSDNDDDGEKGSGAKLAALLELCDVNNVMVVVSRWYGGIHLGSARFKWFASVARDALEEFGFLNNNDS